MRRVVILGRGGSGKSVLAVDLGRATGLPVIELDDEFWNEQLEPMELDAWTCRQTVLAEPPRWIMEGDLGPHDDLEPRLGRADTIVMLDMPLWLCVWRAWRRGNEERGFWTWMLRWRREDRERLLRAVDDTAPDADVVVLRNRRSVRNWLATIAAPAP